MLVQRITCRYQCEMLVNDGLPYAAFSFEFVTAFVSLTLPSCTIREREARQHGQSRDDHRVIRQR
jgi:hypothetical protein